MKKDSKNNKPGSGAARVGPSNNIQGNVVGTNACRTKSGGKSTGKTPAKTPANQNPSEKVYDFEEQADDALRLLLVLFDKAKNGSPKALVRLWKIAHESTKLLENLTHKQKEMLRCLASHSVCWPVLAGPYGQLKKSNDQLIKMLQVGKERMSDMSFDPWRWYKTTEAVTRTWAKQSIMVIMKTAAMYKANTGTGDGTKRLRDYEIAAIFNTTVEELKGPKSPYDAKDLIASPFAKECAELPPFTTETVNEWFELGKLVIMLQCDGKPEQNAELRPLGEDHADRGEIARRNRIFQRIKGAYSSLARIV